MEPKVIFFPESKCLLTEVYCCLHPPFSSLEIRTFLRNLQMWLRFQFVSFVLLIHEIF